MTNDGEPLPEYIIRITNYQYESDINEERSQLQIINPTFVTSFVDMYKNLIETGYND